MYKFILILTLALFSTFLYAETEHDSMVELHLGFYQPNIDDESGLTAPVYEKIFDESGVRFGVNYSYEVFSHIYVGTFSILGGIEYFSVSGKGVYEGSGTLSDDETKLTMIPTELALSYSLDQLQNLFNIPFVLYGKVGLNYNLWWITNGLGNIASFGDDKAIGGKKGWHYGLGLRFLLDVLDSSAADNFDNQYGVNNSYFFVEYNVSSIDDFGGEGLKLGGSYWRFGMALQF